VSFNLLLAVALAAASQEAAPPLPAAESAPAVEALVTPPAPAPKIVLPKGSMVRLMVTKEVNSRDNHPGDRFILRVDEEVRVDGKLLIPIGTKAWGELVQATKTGGVGKSGTINARLLYLEANGKRIDLDGERQSSGGGGTGQVVASVIAFGPFGLLMKGNNATIKAGEILNGYTLADTAFDLPVGAQ